MRWAWTVGKLAGIQIKIHATFALVLIWVAFSHWMTARNWPTVLDGLAFVLAIFSCVLLHELGHALMARKFGIKTHDITLLPIGGLARLERMPDDPKEEILVALAGPAVNVVIAAALFLGIQLFQPWGAPFALDLTQGSIPERLILINVILVVFNLIPAFPMDGGRVLRGLLAIFLNYTLATRIAARLGQVIAVFLALSGLFLIHNPFLVFIALFVWMGAAQETNMIQMKSILSGIPVEKAMLTQYQTVLPSDPLSRAVELALAGSQEDFPVVDSTGQVVGILTRNDLVRGLAKLGHDGLVQSVMTREFAVADASDMLESVMPRLQSSSCKVVPVTRFGELVGLLTPQRFHA